MELKFNALTRAIERSGATTTVLACVLAVASYFFGQPMAIELHWFWMALGTVCMVSLSALQFVRAQRIQRHEDELHAILDAVPHVLFFKDTQFRYRTINAEFARTFRLDPQAAVGQRDRDLFGPGLEERFVAQDRELLASRSARTFDEEIEVTGSGLRQVQSRKQPVYDRRGKPRGIVGVAIDVTEQKAGERRLSEAKLEAERALAELEQSRTDLELALGVGGLGVWRSVSRMGAGARLTDPAFRDTIVTADRKLRDICGYTEDEPLTYWDLLMRTHPEDRQRVSGALEDTYLERRGEYSQQFRIRRPDGVQRTLELRGNMSVHDEPGEGEGDKGTIVSFIGIAKDISEEEALKASLVTKAEEARSAVDAKAHFLAMMSHEVRTPLNGVLGMIDLVLDTPLEDEQRTMLMRCRESSMSLLTIINDILDFSKIEARMLDIESRPLSLASLVEDVCASFGAETARKAIGLGFQVDAAIPQFVVGDAVRLRQVLTNLIGNAIKFTHRGEVRLEVLRTAQGELELAVQDTGIGIDPRAVKTLFEPFRQADIATTRRYGGTGLGLTIVRQLVELMHGSVRCESALGVGSRFIVTLPLRPWVPSVGAAPGRSAPHRLAIDAAARQQQQPAAPARSSPDALPAGRGQRVLLAEDHPINREVITRQLLKLGYACDCAEDGQQAWEMLEAAQAGGAGYAMLLTDCHMPRLDGYELTRRLRHSEAARGLPRLPIVALTANALQGEAERCLALGMDAYLSKPLQIGDLREALSKVLLRQGAAAQQEGAGQAGAGAAGSAAAAPAARYTRLMQLCDGDAAKVARLVGVFVTATEKDLQAMDRAAAAADHAVLRQLAHRLSSACHQLDEDQAVRAFQAVENGDSDPTALALYPAARSELANVMQRAKAFAGMHA
ncbi:PAS domain S-box-containing protein [Variovorax sp. HW608]|uniref:ATP-binding protein n=1 Tax=Variovorax sp. HW608 TaxID=1034889 RepID=UPI00081FA8CB|nr:ATP-binding protein [Variovorax sp. HW608]SCK61739.1 PAS domain S-box-containing protein [Variovorax sp. HW608]